ncbi:hypothetical protein [Pseudomonas sediminis]|uniref:Uncharacterized protein n=1 Tax=Pseudomonas sediminis TaxID=1691904 RepID=A0A2G5FDN3_9PSED|nr:hypothetical protein [Pseudomonas sediminis]PIA66085.1 hypothetical protein CDO35_21305 [Pseudomonas sediminis]
MASEEIVLTAGVASAAYVAQQLFGKTLAEMGDDLNKMYTANRDKLLAKAAKKVADPNDGAKPNLRVARDVIWNGAVTDDEVCAEYFGGILAASRSEDGRDDSALIYVDCIKALSSKQLHLHFVIYNSLHEMLAAAGAAINPGMQDELSRKKVWFATKELERLNLNPVIDLNVLHRQGLVNGYALNQHVVGAKSLPYCNASPTTFGVLLYAAALNYLSSWHQFGNKSFSPAPADILRPSLVASNLEELCKLAGLTDQPASTE